MISVGKSIHDKWVKDLDFLSVAEAMVQEAEMTLPSKYMHVPPGQINPGLPQDTALSEKILIESASEKDRISEVRNELTLIRQKLFSEFPTRYDTNRAVRPRKRVRGLKFWI